MLGYACRRINLQTEPAHLGGEMSGKRLLLAVLSCATILALSAMAQDEKNELGGTFAILLSVIRASAAHHFLTPSFTPAGDGASMSNIPAICW